MILKLKGNNLGYVSRIVFILYNRKNIFRN